MGTDKKYIWPLEHCPSRYQQHHRDGNLSPAKPGLCPDGTVKPPDPSF